MDRDLAIYREVLENLLDGVMVVDFAGTITVANEAACHIFDLERDAVVGRSFAEVFIEFEGFDEFTQIVLDATIQRDSVDRRVTEVKIRDEIRSITITTSYLSAMFDGQVEPVAVIAVFTDISQIRELRETELRLAKENESQHRELQKAYQEVESTNVELSQLLKKVRVARGMSIVLIAGLFLAVSSFYLQPLDAFNFRPLDTIVNAVASVISDDQPVEQQIVPEVNLQTVVVAPSPLNSTISLRGFLAPGNVVGVVSPIESQIKQVNVEFGQQVYEGDVLIELDAEKILVEYRQAEVDYIKKVENLNKLEDWENSNEVADAQRRYRRATLSLDNAKKQLERTNFLLEQGIIPASQQEEAQRSYESQLLDFEAATQEFDSVKNKASAEDRRVAALEVENSRSNLNKLEQKLAMNKVIAPISGIVQELPTGAEKKPLNIGRALAQGDLLLNIANFEQIAVSTTVDEVDVGKIETAQTAWITGPGFPDLRLEGRVKRVASRAVNQRFGRNSPQFEINVALAGLSATHRNELKVGMSAHVTIVIYDQPEALLVPLAAVGQQNNQTWVQVVNKQTGEVEQRNVELGLTTLDSVEVLSGISIGEEVVVSRI